MIKEEELIFKTGLVQSFAGSIEKIRKEMYSFFNDNNSIQLRVILAINVNEKKTYYMEDIGLFNEYTQQGLSNKTNIYMHISDEIQDNRNDYEIKLHYLLK